MPPKSSRCLPAPPFNMITRLKALVYWASACLLLPGLANGAPDKQELMRELYWPPGGQVIVSGWQMETKAEINLNNLPLAEEAEGVKKTQQFDALFSYSGEKYSILFREDSMAGFARENHYWDGTFLITYSHQGNSLQAYGAGKRIDSPFDAVNQSVSLAGKSAKKMLTEAPDDRISIGVSPDKTVIAEINTPDKKILRFWPVENKYIFLGYSIYNHDGILREGLINTFSSRPNRLAEAPLLHVASATTYRVTEIKYVSQIRKLRHLADVAQLKDDAFTPNLNKIVMVTDSRLPTSPVLYQSDVGLVPMDTLRIFANDAAARNAFEKEVYARSSVR
jgi:hypothetical protein